MKRYQLLESWHNGGDNAVDELYCESEHKGNVVEALHCLVAKFTRQGLGEGFPKGLPSVSYNEHGGPVLFLGKDLSSSEHWRSFRFAEVDEKPEWDFRYDEEYPDTAGRNFAGVLSDGRRFLFWHAFADEESGVERCHIYDSLQMLPESEMCSYPWTSENDSKVLETLNGLEDESAWCGEYCPLRTIAFDETGE